MTLSNYITKSYFGDNQDPLFNVLPEKNLKVSQYLVGVQQDFREAEDS